MDEAQSRSDTPPLVVAIADLLLSRLDLKTESGRIEIEYRGGAHLSKLFVHEGFSRTELSRFDQEH